MKNQVRTLRKEKQCPQKELAERVRVSPHCIEAIERERFLPSIQLAYDLAEAFERAVTEVFLPRPPLRMPSQEPDSGSPTATEGTESAKCLASEREHEPTS
jgi:putative transcriptional regulator